ncbi:aminotransferase class I/II-fold pyridoxal phosphate-dependent enzyme [Paenibacillus xylaniclasticus]|uniref:aminotransferase class I/II-fold pyridoxal phosphate-dependent enzyme n=1 Tax=Paenibacillus xylaniclasticus TaxID=588083 RepID=UPI000FD88DAE|nr:MULTISPECIES: aminotransferase class I/II-fold pyridoxal phosphate-dependent enzyme [Paenibacillus]GFN31696.1 aminotransferase [Paenibacillus curdlanolyticus]
MISSTVTKSNSIEELLAPLVRDMKPSGIRKFFELAAGQSDMISLGIGEPDFVTPKPVRDAAIAALEEGRTSYTSNAGMPELRQAIADYVQQSWGVGYDPDDEVLVTVGSSEAIDLALRALITAEDEILVPVPCYISYSPIAAIGYGKPIEVETEASNGFKLTAEALQRAITPRSKVLIVSYPNNPTGATMTYEDWLPIARIVEEHNLVVISDEIYAELTYDSKHVSFASLPGMKERTLLVNGFSKAFAMTGWRVGYACGPKPVIEAMYKIHQYTIMCAPILGQIAALESLRIGMKDMRAMIDSYDMRRRLIVEGFRRIGLPCHVPYGSFYAFPSIKHTGLTSEQFAERLLKEGKVVTVPGSVFGRGGEGYIRCSYATSVEQIEEALIRIERFVHTL